MTTRIYGKWAGNPKGIAEIATRCIEAIYRERFPVTSQCTRKRGHGPDGLYCTQHAKRLTHA